VVRAGVAVATVRMADTAHLRRTSGQAWWLHRGGTLPPMAPRDDLAASLRSLDGASYGRYKSLTGRWQVAGIELEVLRVQADPFAPPSRVRLTVDDAGLPADLYASADRRRALAGFLLRGMRRAQRGDGARRRRRGRGGRGALPRAEAADPRA
jgi:hypothetical protein